MSEVNEFRGVVNNEMRYASSSAAVNAAAGDWKFQVAEFAKRAAEMSVEFGKGVRDVMKQTVLRDDSVIMRKLRFLNEYLPEDREPVHSWTVIACVSIIALAVLIVNMSQTTTPLVNKMKVHPSSGTLILLPDVRCLAYHEQGVPSGKARYSIVAPHSFLSSRLAGVPGVKGTLLEEFGIRLVTYDLPGFGESDPDPKRDLDSSAMDMLH